MAVSEAKATWSGDLTNGKGKVGLSSGVVGEMEMTWKARTDRPQEATSPEELLAAAHAACLSMALSNILAGRGTPPESLQVTARVSFERGDQGFRVSSSHLDVEAKVPGIKEEDFQQALAEAKDGCPVSGALKGNVELTASGKLV